MYSDEDIQRADDDVEISQWASDVYDFSDCYGNPASISYSSVNLCGRPSKYPAYGDFAECFSMRRYGPSNEKEFSPKEAADLQTFHDFAVLQFETCVLPTSLKIYETYNPGTIFRIYAYFHTVMKWEVLWEMSVIPCEKKAREFCPPIKKVNLPTQ